MLYGIPPSANAYARLKPIKEALGPDSLSFLIDHPVQLHNFILDAKNHEDSPIPIFANIDVGYHREGVEPGTKSLQTLLEAIAHSQKSKGPPHIKLIGFYSHNSLSYAVSSPDEAMQYLGKSTASIHVALCARVTLTSSRALQRPRSRQKRSWVDHPSSIVC